MALNADITIIMAGLACLQIPAGFAGVFSRPLVRGHNASGMAGLALGSVEIIMSRSGGSQFDIAELATVRLELDAVSWKSGVALAAVLLVMATGAGLRIVLGLKRVQHTEVAAVAPGFVIAAKVLNCQIGP